jgi:hypothetical protein
MVGQQPGGVIAVGDPQLSPGAVAIGVHGGLRHPQLAGDLLGAEMTIHQAQAFPFPRGQQFDLFRHDPSSPMDGFTTRYAGVCVHLPLSNV